MISWVRNLLFRKAAPMISVGPIPVTLSGDPHKPWRLAESVVGPQGLVSLLGGKDDAEWAPAQQMADWYGLRLIRQLRELSAPVDDSLPWSIRGIETVHPYSAASPKPMCSVSYDLPPTGGTERGEKYAAKRYALEHAEGHVAFSLYPELSGVITIGQLREYLQPLADAAKRRPGKIWVSESGATGTMPEFQATFYRLLLAIPGLAGVHVTFVADSPAYADAQRAANKPGADFWSRLGLFDIAGNARPAADVIRGAARR